MDEERWVPIDGFEGCYEVSDAGRVRSLDRVVGGRVIEGRIMRSHTVRHGGREQVGLSREGRRTMAYVSRLVASAFVPNPDLLPDVEHINGDQSDDRACNLRWIEHKTNAAERWSDDRAQAVARSDGRIFPSATAAADALGVSVTAIATVARDGGTCQGYSFRYLDDMYEDRDRSLDTVSSGGEWRTARVKNFSADKMLRAMREQGIRVTDMAGATGISVSQLYSVRNGKKKPSEYFARKIAASLGMGYEELLD